MIQFHYQYNKVKSYLISHNKQAVIGLILLSVLFDLINMHCNDLQ